MMVQSNNSHFYTPFTVSVDLIGKGCTTGISASDRAKTVQALIDPATKSNELGKPDTYFLYELKVVSSAERAIRSSC